MTSNSQTPSAAGAAPVWQPMPLPVDTEPAEAAEGPGDAAEGPGDAAEGPGDAAASGAGSTVVFAPGYANKQRAKAKGRRAGSTTVLLMVGALVAVGGVGFALGHNVSGGSGSNNAAANGQNGFRPDGSFNPGQFGPNASGNPDRALGGGSVTGTVESVTADSMTIKLANGQTVTVALGSSTTYHSQASASSSQVTTGSTVIVQTSGGSQSANAAASAGTGATNRTATDVTVTSK